MKTIAEFLSYVTTFPTTISYAIGNGWTAEEVYAIGLALQKSQGIENVPFVKPVYGALNPNRFDNPDSYHLQ